MNTRYEFNMDVPPREAIRLLYVSKSRFGGDWNSVPHTHPCTEVFYCVDGHGQFNVEGKMLDVAPDDMGRVIGKQGRIAKAIRTVMRARAVRADEKISVEID